MLIFFIGFPRASIQAYTMRGACTKNVLPGLLVRCEKNFVTQITQRSSECSNVL